MAFNVSADTIVVLSVLPTAAPRRLFSTSPTCSVQYSVVAVREEATVRVRAALGDVQNLAPTLLSALLHSGDEALAVASSVVPSPNITEYATGEILPCAPGTYLDAISQACVMCAAGSYAGKQGASACDLAPQNTFVDVAGATAYVACPSDPDRQWLSFSPPGSVSLFNCSCAYGSYAHSVEDDEKACLSGGNTTEPCLSSSTFICAECPSGALCIGAWNGPGSGTAPPLALEGFWHEAGVPTVMYECEEKYCIAEKPPAASGEPAFAGEPGVEPEAEAPLNCRQGHTGVVCGSCLPGWRIQEGFCEPCNPAASIAAWREDRRGALAAVLLFLFIAVSLPVLLAPLAGGSVISLMHHAACSLRLTNRSNLVTTDHGMGDQASSGRRLVAYASAFLEFISEPAFILVESLQILSSFRHTTHVAWPPLFRTTIDRLSILNLNFIKLPKVACLSPFSTLYDEFNGITLSVTAILAYFAAVWACGTAWARARHLPDAVRTAFNRRTTARCLLLLKFAYAPVSEVVLSILCCREIGGLHYLTAETEIRCYSSEHAFYRALAVFWIVVYIIGTPALIGGLLLYYRIHEAARRVRKTAMLHQLVNIAAQRNVALPEYNIAKMTPATISAEQVDALFAGLMRGGSAHTHHGLDQHGHQREHEHELIAHEHEHRHERGAESHEPEHEHEHEDKHHEHHHDIAVPNDGPLHDRTLSGTDTVNVPPLARAEALLLCSATVVSDELSEGGGNLTVIAGEHQPAPPPPAPPKLSRDEKLHLLLRWGKQTLAPSHYTWRELSAADDPRREGAAEAIGELFENTMPVRWWWKLWEAAVKLFLTSVLLFVQPGSPAQIVAGLFASFAFLLFYLKMLSYSSKPVRQVAYCCSLVIYLFFLMALLLKMQVPVSNSETVTTDFYAGITAFLLYGLLIAPIVIILKSGFADVRVGEHGASRPQATLAEVVAQAEMQTRPIGRWAHAIALVREKSAAVTTSQDQAEHK